MIYVTLVMFVTLRSAILCYVMLCYFVLYYVIICLSPIWIYIQLTSAIYYDMLKFHQKKLSKMLCFLKRTATVFACSTRLKPSVVVYCCSCVAFWKGHR